MIPAPAEAGRNISTAAAERKNKEKLKPDRKGQTAAFSVRFFYDIEVSSRPCTYL